MWKLFLTALISIQAHAFIVGGKDLSYNSELASSVVVVASPDEKGREKICTGIFISNEFVLTAAHCVVEDFMNMSMNFRPKEFKKNRAVRDLEIMSTHTFQLDLQRNDLALIRFRGGLPEGATIMQLPAKELAQPLKKLNFIALGYGISNGITNVGSKELRFKPLMVDVVEPTLDTFTVDQKKNKGGVCNGDSGGPAVIKGATTKKNIIIGVASGTIKDDLDDALFDKCKNKSLYLNMFFYAPLIRQKITELTQ